VLALKMFDTKFSMLHWVIWDIPATVHELPEGLTSGYELTNPMGAHQVANMGTDAFGGHQRLAHERVQPVQDVVVVEPIAAEMAGGQLKEAAE